MQTDMEIDERKHDRLSFSCHSRRNCIFGIHFGDAGKSTATNLSSSYAEESSWIYIDKLLHLQYAVANFYLINSKLIQKVLIYF